MYSVVLAVALTTGGATPDWHSYGCHGCHGCHGCYGSYNAFSSGCCGGCYGCSGCCGGCWGCCGGCYGCCGGCYGCGGGVAWSGSYAVAPYNFYSCSGCGGCWGCCGGYGSGVVVVPAPAPGVPRAIDKSKLPNPKPETSAPRPGSVYVMVNPGTRLIVNEQPVTMSGTEESFTTPVLEPGQKYSYVIQAETTRDGKTVTTTKKVVVAAGEETRVDLRLPAAARVSVALPEDARLFVDDVPYPATQEKITFETPKLEPERTYYYTLRAEVVRDGKVLRDSRRIDVAAGKEVKVEFKDMPVVHALQR